MAHIPRHIQNRIPGRASLCADSGSAVFPALFWRLTNDRLITHNLLDSHWAPSNAIDIEFFDQTCYYEQVLYGNTFGVH